MFSGAADWTMQVLYTAMVACVAEDAAMVAITSVRSVGACMDHLPASRDAQQQHGSLCVGEVSSALIAFARITTILCAD